MSSTIRTRSAALQRFTGGLNNYWDQSSINDAELAGIVNFEFSTNGAITSRPAIYAESTGITVVGTPATGEPIDILGTYVKQNGDRFLVCVTDSKTWLYNVEAFTFTQIAAFRASDCTQYDDKVVLCSTYTPGGYWNGTTFTVTNMPLLGGIELFQNRFFGYGVEGTGTASTLYWSDITTFGPAGELTSIWDWTDDTSNYYYVEIGVGDGQWITAMAQGYGDVVIFRNRSTYRYSYGDTPETGTMQVMQQDIGAENKRSVVKFENAHFVLSGGVLYKYQNWLYYPLNAQRVRFSSTLPENNRFQHAVSIVGRRCLVWHDGALYSYNLDTDTWSEWQSASKVAYFVELARISEQGTESSYYGVSGVETPTETTGNKFCFWRIEDSSITVNGAESFECSLRTKIYDFDTPVEWKRLYFWAADVQTARPVKAVAYPVSIPENALKTSWDELSKDFDLETGFYTWDQLSKDDPSDVSFGTWDLPSKPSGGIATVIDDFPQDFPLRMEVKLNQALRFRRIYFELYLTCDGTASTSPVQIFSIIPLIGAKAKIAKGAN
jgi:hypothetical protein